ncbi:MAG: penicillin-binding protein 2 [Streptococcaceae bacterium]|nr:penicillin-binding protein 2 [Streptococcaceae bacterium]
MPRKNRREEQKRAIKKKRLPSINLRVNILFTVIFALFLILLGRLYYMQVIDRQFYADKLKQNDSNTTITTSFPRGQIFDAKGRPLATTTTVPSVTFTRQSGITSEEMRNNAVKLVPILRDFIDAAEPTDYDKRDFYLADPANLKKIAAQLPASKQVDKNGKRLTEAQKYAIYNKMVPADQVQYQGDDLLAVELFKLMNGTAAFATTNLVSGDISQEVLAQVGSKQGDYPGISVGTNWDYHVDENNLLNPLIGSISSTKAGLPDNSQNTNLPSIKEYLDKGYSMNDRVGISYIQQGYEDVLQGKHEETKVVVGPKGEVKSKTVIQAGAQGKNLKLTVDLDFENAVQEIIQNAMNQIAPKNPYSKGVYTVVLNSQTGAILSMNGIKRDPETGEQTVSSALPMQSNFIPGSTVKPGTLTAGWESGVISGNQEITSQPIQLAGSNPIRDWNSNGFGTIRADEALEYSSNTYMLQVALKILGQNYTPNMMVSTTNRVKAYDVMRSAYGQYGLGTSTGIDIPGEETGQIPSTDKDNTTVANLLLESFGQFDNYTPLQLAQYAQTIANNGARLAPHIVEGIYESDDNGLGKEESTIKPKTLNKVNISQDLMNVIQLGMKEVVYGGNNSGWATGKEMANGAKAEIYAKTGTSEKPAPNGGWLTVNNVIGYAPGPSPQIAIGIMIPDLSEDSHINQTVMTQIVNKAVEMKVIK